MPFQIPLSSQFAAITIDPLSISRDLTGSIDFGGGRYIVVNPSFEIEEFWQRQLGEIKTNQGVYFSEGGTVLCGGNSAGRVNIRSVQDLNPFVWPRETVTAVLDNAVVNRAQTIASGLESMYVAEHSYRRLKRGFHSYLDGMTGKHEETRMRHFVRSIEAFIRPAIGKTRRHFVHRGQLFVGFSNDMCELLGDLYDLRSCAEHMNDIHDLYSELSELEIDKRTAMGSFQSQVIANHAYRRAFKSLDILKFFISDSSIEAFWEKPSNEQKEIWGEPVNISSAVKGTLQSILVDS